MLKVAGPSEYGFYPPAWGHDLMFAGAYRGPSRWVFMRTKRAVDVEPNRSATPTAVRRLLSEISTDELESIAVEVIRDHRRRLQRAQELFELLERKEEDISTRDELHQLRQEHRMAMLNLHAQHHLVNLVVSALGYVPDVDGAPSATDAPN